MSRRGRTSLFSWTAGQESTAIPIASGACEDLSRSGDGLIVAKIGRKPGIPALRVTGKGSGCIRCMIVSVCSAFWLFLREIVLIDAKSGGKATVWNALDCEFKAGIPGASTGAAARLLSRHHVPRLGLWLPLCRAAVTVASATVARLAAAASPRSRLGTVALNPSDRAFKAGVPGASTRALR